MPAPDQRRQAAEVRERLAAGEQVWVSGPAGSGRATLVEALLRDTDITYIDLPSLADADAGAALVLLCLCGVRPEQREVLDGAPLRDILAAIPPTSSFVVRVPHSWSRFGDTVHGRRAQENLSRLGVLRRLAWVADSSVDPSRLGVRPDLRIPLPPFRTTFAEDIAWSSYSTSATRLADAVGSELELSPVLWRLAVGAVALGRPVGEIARTCERSPEIAHRELPRMLAEEIAKGPSELRRCVTRLLKIRRPLPAQVAMDVVAPPKEHQPLISQCLAYGDPLRIVSSVRSALGHVKLGSSDEDTHMQLAEVHRMMDGVSHPARAGTWSSMSAWIEKVHHLAHAGEQGVAEWSTQHLSRRELYWDRARYLSMERNDYTSAVDVYSKCLEHFPDDDYALHYRAYNRQRAAGRVTAQALADYAEAAARAPDNPWWNSRNITALIRAKRPVEARRAWQAAIEAIDPEGERLESDPWLFSNLHYWVARAWLKVDAWCTARSILALVPDDIFQCLDAHRAREVADMRARIDDAERREWERFVSWIADKQDEEWKQTARIVSQLREQIPLLPPPIADDGEDGPSLTWSRPGVYVELEVLGSGVVDWFARDRVFHRREGVDDAVGWDDERLMKWLEKASRE